MKSPFIMEVRRDIKNLKFNPSVASPILQWAAEGQAPIERGVTKIFSSDNRDFLLLNFDLSPFHEHKLCAISG